MDEKNKFLLLAGEDLKTAPSTSQADISLAKEIHKSILDRCDFDPEQAKRLILSMHTKKLPRYLVNSGGSQKCDTVSAKWSPGFYRMDKSMQILKDKLSGANVLDVYAGSGSMMHTILAMNIPSSVTLNDICYRGGPRTITRDGYYYSPADNAREYDKLFEKYQASIPRPDFNKVQAHTHSDIQNGLDFGRGSFDYVFTDPPYAKNLEEGGCNDFIKHVPEVLRVTTEGALVVMPEEWVPIIKSSGTCKIETISNPLVHKDTTFRTTLTHLY